MKAQRSFTVRPSLPLPLEPLSRLAGNLRWAWDRPTRRVFAAVERRTWGPDFHDPRRILAETPSDRLDELASDAAFLERMAGANASLEAYLSLPRWFQGELAAGGHADGLDGVSPLEGHVVAYFSPEFGISEALPQYSGGLGVLAGDHLKAASDLGVPVVGIGLFYRHGYFRQSLSVDGWQQERFPDLDPHALALELCEDIRVEVDLAGEPMAVQVWRAEVGRVRLYLLDADLPENPRELQLVTDRLYGGDIEHRLRQEILLGIGGVRALAALGEPVRVFHTNEGHAGFLGLERIRRLMAEQAMSFPEALEAVRAGSVFTTHTPVPAGIDRFPRELIEKYFSGWAEQCGITVDHLMALGHRPDDPPEERFNMAVLGMRLAEYRNGVSALHGDVSRHMFADLWPAVAEREVPIGHITNGVHGATWVTVEMDELLSAGVGQEWQTAGADEWEAVTGVDDDALWAARAAGRARMVDDVRRRMHAAGIAAGRSASELEWVDEALDPDALTICFARRMATYKRAQLLLSQPERLRALLADDDRPVQFVFAGKAHPADDRGKEIIRQVVSFSHDFSVRDRFVFVEDYDMALARALVQGADIWLNTPVRPMEASGTSGMKSVMNGGLHCSVLDGWWAECFSAGLDAPERVPNGWAISSAETVADEHRRTELEANSLFELLETQIVPVFHDRGPDGLPTAWLARVKESLRTLGPFVGAHRMVRDYVHTLYLPAAGRSAMLATHGWSPARELAAYRARLGEHWHRVHVDEVVADESIADLGATRGVAAVVALGELTPDEVEVQLVVGRVGQTGELESPTVVPMADAGPLDGAHRRFEGSAPLDVAGRMGVTVRIVPRHALAGDVVDLGHVAWA
jgi:starch phosphorylase